MTSPIQSFLPAAIAAASPLLLAAAQPPTTDAMRLSCGFSSAGYREVIAPTQSASGVSRIVHPVASSPRALVTSAHEWTTIWRETVQPLQAQNLPVEAGPSSLAFVEDTAIEDAVVAAPTQAQPRCNRKEEPTETPASTPSEPTDSIPNLDPSALPPAVPAPPSAATPLPDFSVPDPSIPETSIPELPVEGQPAETTPDMSEPPASVSPPSVSPALTIPARPIAPPLSDPDIDPTNVTPTSESATPFDGVVVPALETLPDGVYRYLSGNYEYGVYSHEQLTANGGAVFLLTKTGDRIIGNFYPKFGQAGVCVDGTLRGSSIFGPAYVMNAVVPEGTVSDLGDRDEPAAIEDTYEPYAGLSSFQVRQPQRVGDRLFYAESLLDLSEYSRINAGTSLAPSECDVPVAETETP